MDYEVMMDMESEKSLLSEIRTKEDECVRKLEEARTQAEATIAAAHENAAEIIRHAEHEAVEEEKVLQAAEREDMQQEIDGIQARSERELAALREKGNANLPAAVDQLVRAVLPG
ncbi:MAG: hypothetical protein GKC04_01465 [Methanomicrobiales archaeon]|nr:hypothetical protein [Methanomicrobiales archaeon]